MIVSMLRMMYRSYIGPYCRLRLLLGVKGTTSSQQLSKGLICNEY